ncbi:uncharacterized protein LOC119458301 isoform X9 [Dermacentor silvarum]|uniref:uncharacterized protein LOC119458301 isoform X9 n=1 Tax=Dermacentor silvarum TaxID=543639 RepID=UPI00210076BF|nr:uncharacterized protein LOC119458301 isoform X9 [Dermacentor silvarum]
MATKHLFTVLLFTTSLSILECRLMMAKSALSGMKSVSRVGMRHPFYTQDCKEGSIAKFLCTNEPIWLYNSTGGPGRECEVDETMNISQTAILLLRSHYENGMKKSIYLNGTFDQRDAKRMFLHIPGGQKGMRDHLTEDMLYLSQKLRCAVFKITLQSLHLPSQCSTRKEARNKSITAATLARNLLRSHRRRIKKYRRMSIHSVANV